MLTTIPGTKLPLKEHSEHQISDVLSPIFSMTNGLTLSQVTEITGLEGTTIQNWVKRGWVAKPLDKRYGEQQVLRIILINILRGSMKLEHIAELMVYINGEVEDRSDDLVSEKELLNMLELVLRRCNKDKSLDNIENHVHAQLADYIGPTADAKERLFNTLVIMALAYISTLLREKCEEKMKDILLN